MNAFQPPPLARKLLGSRTSSITSSVSSLSSSVSEQSEEVEVSDHEIPGSLSGISDSVGPGESTVKVESDVPSKEDAASANRSEAESSSSQVFSILESEICLSIGVQIFVTQFQSLSLQTFACLFDCFVKSPCGEVNVKCCS